MRIKANVDIVNRVSADLSVKTSGKAAHTQLSIGKKPGSKDESLYLMMCTAKDRNGSKYSVSKNLQLHVYIYQMSQFYLVNIYYNIHVLIPTQHMEIKYTKRNATNEIHVHTLYNKVK